MRRLLRRSLRILGANLAVWLVLELCAWAALQAMAPDLMGADRKGEPADKSWLRQARLSFESGLYVWDPHCLWRLRPNYRGGTGGGRRFWGSGPLVLNQNGMRGPSRRVEKPENIRRVLILGGSHPMGMYNNYRDTYGARLERALGRRWQVLNAAAPGHTSFQARAYLEYYGLAYEPDIVIVDAGTNDTLPLSPAFPRPDHQVKTPPRWAVEASSKLRFSAVYRLISRLLRPDPAPPTTATAATRVPPNQHALNLKAMRALAARRGFKLLVINQFRADLSGTGRIQCLFREEKAPALVDACAMWESLGDVRAYFADPVHANAAGHALLADLILKRLRALGWVAPIPAPPSKERVDKGDANPLVRQQRKSNQEQQ